MTYNTKKNWCRHFFFETENRKGRDDRESEKKKRKVRGEKKKEKKEKIF